MMRSRKARVTLGAAVALAAGAAVVTTLALGGSAPGAEDDLAILRKEAPRTSADQLPAGYTAHNSAVSLGRVDPETSRRVYARADVEAYVARGAGDFANDICLVTKSGAPGATVYGTSCKPGDVVGAPRLGTYQDTEDSPVLVTGIIPDGYTAAVLRTPTETVRVPVRENVVVVEVPAAELPAGATLIGTDGSSKTISIVGAGRD